MNANVKAKNGSQLKILIFRLFVFSFLGLALLVLVNEYLERLLSRHGSNHYFEQYRELIDHKVNANIVILGSSRSHMGINPHYLDDKDKTYYNFSADAAFGYFYNIWYDLFKKYYPKPDMIILEVGNHWFDLAGVPLSSHVDSFPLKIFLDAMFSRDFPTDPDFPTDSDFPTDPDSPTDPLYPSNYKSFLKKKNKSMYLQNILTNFYPAKDENRGAYHGYVPFGDEMISNPDNAPHNYSNNTIRHFAPKRFLDFIHKLLRDKIKIVFVDLPEFIPNRIRNKSALKMVTDLANTESNIVLLDYNSEDNVTDFNYSGKYFHDYGHLNKEGSTIFSKRLKQDLDNLEASASLSRDAVALSQLSYDRLTDYGRRAKQRGDHATAQLFFAEGVKKAEKFPMHDPRLQTALENLAGVYWEAGHKAEADLLLKRIEALPDPLHPGLIAKRFTSGIFFVDQGDLSLLPFDQCIEYGRQTRENGNLATARLYFGEARRKAEKFNPYDPRLMTTLETLAEVYRKEGRLAEGEILLKRVLDFRAKYLGTMHPELIATQTALAELYISQGRHNEASLLLTFGKCAEYGLKARQSGDYALAHIYFAEAIKKAENTEMHGEINPLNWAEDVLILQEAYKYEDKLADAQVLFNHWAEPARSALRPSNSK